jgi:predicted CxxxxCH...CXXCH cytochrome family protein
MKAKKLLWILGLLLALAFVLFLSSCKTERDQNTVLGPHPTGWMDPASANFHGQPAVRDSNSCRSCHGEDLHGGTSGSSCYTCHASYPHPVGWINADGPAFHGLVARMDSSRQCQTCHGADYRGGNSGVACFTCHRNYPHIENANWLTLTPDTTFHGWATLVDSVQGQSCTPCHGADFRGTPIARSCYDCHNGLHVGVNNEDTDTHRAFVASKGWALASCKVCHDSTFTGGPAATVNEEAACTACHATTNVAMDLGGCNVCHTTEPDARPYWKVPFGMDSAAAGAHTTHVTENNYGCRECHPSLSASGHPHALPADAGFIEGRVRFANLFGMQPVVSHNGPANSGNATCSNVYCHTNGVHPTPGAPVTFPGWRSTLHCGACHGIPPTPAENPSHPQNAVCSACHSSVDPTSNFAFPDSIRFVADSLHVDGSYHR